MGLEWLSAVMQTLTAAGFRVERGYPGKAAAALSGAVAAVDLTGVDLSQQTAQITVTVLSPRQSGLEACQEMALTAATALAEDGQQWKFSGWKYDSGTDCFAVEVLGTASFASEDSDDQEETQQSQTELCVVVVGDMEQSYVTDFLAQQKADRAFVLAHGQGEPVGVTPGVGGWTVRLTQMIPPGQKEPEENTGSFFLSVNRNGCLQKFGECYWTAYSSQQCAEGTEVIRTGLALSREVSLIG